MAFITILLVLVGIAGGTLSFKANSALPGESLYPYKLQVNERVESFVAHTDDAKARWHLMMLKERLREARQLAKTGRLDSGSQHAVTENIQEHVKSVTALVHSLQARGLHSEASLLASAIHQTLSVETQRVADVSSLGSANLQLSLAPILTRLRTMNATVSLISTKAYAKAANVETTPVENPAVITSNVKRVTEIKNEELKEPEQATYFR